MRVRVVRLWKWFMDAPLLLIWFSDILRVRVCGPI